MRPHVKSGWEEWTTGIILALETQTPFIQLLVDQEIYCE